ncbi:MAG: 50S ribosomal protein L18 [Sphaerochaeta sp.]|uniref:50S ribosomal protein L18 n=1 Tax=Sphaerochaeta sp. TaxID=1972642 RepID=UPI00169CE4FF|nr:50S ribosomal protein L18 [uncultured Sphaerochaeta sp.]MDD3058843.1 50S ribosomal protein L18 [Sphaerochaeta sp.]NCC14394.1 50S ribosomal protein L18 [Spirochaetia bacterium]NLK05585.1 50S ribosomal protein L18 [Spirochaetales bacterium]MDD3929247.1 50S ribosomal protein L18 [Sphaerochaeta sp.]NCC90791.1 50S ribosomal protein L18 [Spirochaetia bacterium]
MNRVIDKRKKLARRKHHIRKNLSGTASRPRMSVFRSNSHMYVQVIDDVAGSTLVAASTMEGELKGLKNTVADAAKLGETIGKRMLEKNIDTCVFDRNGYLFHGIVKGIADGARKAGVKF